MSDVVIIYLQERQKIYRQTNLHKNFDQSHFALLQHDLMKFSEGN